MRIRAVVFDWAGTVVDYGCHAPAVVLRRIFAQRGIALEPAECRHAMGMPKMDQIRAILELPRVRSQWCTVHGSAPGETIVQELFQAFSADQLQCIEEHSAVIPGVPALVEALRSAGVLIGSTTGYSSAIMRKLQPYAARQGYSPDCVVTPDDVGSGRPAPWMMFENMRRLNVFPPDAVVKVGDTRPDMQEGRNAGAWCIGVSASSSDAVLESEENVRQMLLQSGAHYVTATAAELLPILEEL